jgi:hypothetical protein
LPQQQLQGYICRSKPALIMKKISSILLLATSLFLFSFMKHTNNAKDWLGVPGPLSFGGTSYQIAWSSHPSDNYYKQEYVEKGDDVNHYNKMILVEVLLSETIQPKDAVANKMAELEQRKKTDAMVNYQVIANQAKTEYTLDFLLSDGKPSGTVEWNAYRYKSFTDKSGHKGLMLFAISHRAYGDKIKPFLTSLKGTRTSTINTLAGYTIPAVTIQK